MSLQRALDRLSHDRATESVVRDVLDLFRRHVGEWLSREHIRSIVADPAITDTVLREFADTFVLDFEDAPPRYRYLRDPLVDIETERYLRRAEQHERKVQSNLARFRRRYGGP